MRKTYRKIYTDSGILVFEAGQHLSQRPHAFHVSDMVSVVLNLTLFQWSRQFFISTSDFTPEIPG
jgi:hypothetical protein